MTEKITGVIDAIAQAINHKATNMAVAAGVVVASQAADKSPQFKSLSDIPITEIFIHPLSASAWLTVIGGAFIIFQFSREIIKAIYWVIKKNNSKNCNENV